MVNWQAFIQRYCGKSAVMALFLLCALPVSVLTALVTPPGQSPDEETHFGRALGLLHGAVLGQKTSNTDPNTGKPQGQTGVKVDAGLFGVSFGSVTQMDNRPVETLDDWNKIERAPQNPTLFYVNLPNTATYFPAAYVPATLGVAVARAFNATPLHCFLTARLFMASAFVLVGLATIGITAYGEAVLVTVLLLPMTVFLAGTLNQDGLLTAMTCLALACLTRATRGWRIAGLIIFALVLGAKPPYILLLGVFALPLFMPGFWQRFFDMVLVMLPLLGWIVVIALFVVVPYGKVPYHPGPLYTGDHNVMMDHANAKAQLDILLERPRRLLALPYYGTVQFAYTDYLTLIGVLGPLQMILDPGIYTGWAICLIFAALGLLVTRRAELVLPRNALIGFIAVMGAVLVTYWLLEITFYLDWTEVGSPYIDGIQGRYLLIFLPFVLFAIPHVSALPGLGRVRFSVPPLLLALPSLGMGLFDVGYIPLKLVLNYYLH
jgi:uncharacterized membrane protein